METVGTSQALTIDGIGNSFESLVLSKKGSLPVLKDMNEVLRFLNSATTLKLMAEIYLIRVLNKTLETVQDSQKKKLKDELINIIGRTRFFEVKKAATIIDTLVESEDIKECKLRFNLPWFNAFGSLDSQQIVLCYLEACRISRDKHNAPTTDEIKRAKQKGETY